MKPKNSKERRNSVLKFIILFLCTTGLIVAALFFDFNRVPLKENKVLRERAVAIEKEMKFQGEFSNEINNVRSLIDSLDVPGQNLPHINSLITSKIVDIQKSLPKEDSTYRYEMYTNMVQTYVDIQQMKGKLLQYEDIDKTLEEYKEEIDRLRDELNQANRNLDAYRL